MIKHLNYYKRHSAFSVLELSIVLLIIAALTVGIVVTSPLRNVRIINARSVTTQSGVAKIDGLVAWYETSAKKSIDVSQGYEGAQITKWTDINPFSLARKNASGNNDFIITASPKLTYKASSINSLPGLLFANQAINLGKFYQGTLINYTVFLVFSPSNISDTATQIFDSGTAGNSAIKIAKNAIALNSTSVTTTATIKNSEPYIMAAYFAGASSKVFLNNSSIVIGGGPYSLDGISLGSSGFMGVISEVIVYSSILKVEERKEVMNYLAKKYKISIQ